MPSAGPLPGQRLPQHPDHRHPRIRHRRREQGRAKQSIVKIASEFLNIIKSFDQIKFYDRYSLPEIVGIVPDKVNEVEIRRYEMLVHNLQSSFDTYVIHGGFRYGNRKLKQLRGFFSVVFHLLQMIGRLLHSYERHLHEAGYKNTYKKVQDHLSALVPPDQLLDCTEMVITKLDVLNDFDTIKICWGIVPMGKPFTMFLLTSKY